MHVCKKNPSLRKMRTLVMQYLYTFKTPVAFVWTTDHWAKSYHCVLLYLEQLITEPKIYRCILYTLNSWSLSPRATTVYLIEQLITEPKSYCCMFVWTADHWAQELLLYVCMNSWSLSPRATAAAVQYVLYMFEQLITEPKRYSTYCCVCTTYVCHPYTGLCWWCCVMRIYSRKAFKQVGNLQGYHWWIGGQTFGFSRNLLTSYSPGSALSAINLILLHK